MFAFRPFLLSLISIGCVPNLDSSLSESQEETDSNIPNPNDTETDTGSDEMEMEDTEEGRVLRDDEACHDDIVGWNQQWTDIEDEVVELVNEIRAQGTNCGSYGEQAPAGPVVMDPHLRCSARYHSIWMNQTGVFDHDSPGGDLGDDPWQRIAATDFSGYPTGENIAVGYGSAQDVMSGWLSSDGHCSNIMMQGANVIGIGFYGNSRYWTQNFGWID